MEFEFDPEKSAINKEKHGINFGEAQALWLDRFSIALPARDKDEPRMMVIGRIADKHWSAIVARRNGRIRIISVRRARKQGVDLYESQRSR